MFGTKAMERVTKTVEPQVLSTPGGASKWWCRQRDEISNFIRKTTGEIEAHAQQEARWEQTKAQEEAQRDSHLTKKQRAQRDFQREKSELATKLRGLGVEIETELDDHGKSLDDPIQFHRRELGVHVNAKAEVLRAYEACWKALFSLHGIQLQSGTNKVSITFQGVDLFEIFPEP